MGIKSWLLVRGEGESCSRINAVLSSWKWPLHQSVTVRPVSGNKQHQEGSASHHPPGGLLAHFGHFLNSHVLSRSCKAGKREHKAQEGRGDGARLSEGQNTDTHVIPTSGRRKPRISNCAIENLLQNSSRTVKPLGTALGERRGVQKTEL